MSATMIDLEAIVALETELSKTSTVERFTVSQRNARRRPRRAILAWLPSIFLAVVIALVAVVAFLIDRSWWADDSHRPTADQQAGDGSSLFTAAGIDYLNRDGLVVFRLRPGDLSAADLGLPEEGTKEVQLLTPIEARFLGPEASLKLDLVDVLEIETRHGRILGVEALYAGSGRYRDIRDLLARLAPRVGWTSESIAVLEDRLTAAQSQRGDATSYSADIDPGARTGLLVSARVTIDVEESYASITFQVRRE